MTTAGTRRVTGLGVHVIYPQLQSYDIDHVRKYLGAISAVWDACVDVAGADARVRVPSARGLPDDVEVPTQRTLQLWIDRLTIGSPMDITFAVGGVAGSTMMALFVARLFVQALREPTKIGSWLPLILAGWHQGMVEAEKQKSKRRTRKRRMTPDSPESQELVNASAQLIKLGLLTQQVTLIGDVRPNSVLPPGELPDPRSKDTETSD